MTEIRRFRFAFLAVLALSVGTALGAGGCGESVPADATIATDSAGVLVATAPAEDLPLDWRLTLEREVDLSPLDLFRLWPHHLAALPDGRFVVLDDTNNRLYRLAPDGTVERTFAGPGEGPGELASPSSVTVAGDTILVVDPGRRGLLFFTEAGEARTESLDSGFWGPALHRHEGGHVYVRLPGGGTRIQDLVYARASEMHALARLEREPERPADLVKCGLRGFPVAPLYAPELVWDARGDTIAAVSGPEYRVEVLGLGGRLGRVLRRDAREVEPSRALAVAEIQGEELALPMMGRVCELTVDELVDWRGVADPIPPIRWITLLPGGETWVTRRTARPGLSVVDVWTAEGMYAGTLTVEGGVPVAGFPSGDVVVLGRDALDRPTLRVFSVERGPVQAELHVVSAAPSIPTGSPAPGTTRRRPSGKGAGERVPVSDRPLADGEFRDCPACPGMVEIPGGTFLMGAPDGEAPAAAIPTRPAWTERAEKPRVEVTIEPFAIGKYEVTFEEWSHCVAAGGCGYEPEDPGEELAEAPVAPVSRAEAEEYAAWLGRATGHEYRLPSEAEWEYAARAGTSTARWWGDEIGSGLVACDGCGTRWDGRSRQPVGAFPANPWGFHDMLSNVFEWVADCWHESHEGAPADGTPRIETSPWWKNGGCERPVIRGASSAAYPWAVRAAFRRYWWPGPWKDGERSGGFRVARWLEP